MLFYSYDFKKQSLAQHHDPIDPVKVVLGGFVKIDRYGKDLNFFDDRLRKTKPGLFRTKPDFTFFDELNRITLMDD